MKIYTHIEMEWDGQKYVVTRTRSFNYEGTLASCKGDEDQQGPQDSPVGPGYPFSRTRVADSGHMEGLNAAGQWAPLYLDESSQEMDPAKAYTFSNTGVPLMRGQGDKTFLDEYAPGVIKVLAGAGLGMGVGEAIGASAAVGGAESGAGDAAVAGGEGVSAGQGTAATSMPAATAESPSTLSQWGMTETSPGVFDATEAPSTPAPSGESSLKDKLKTAATVLTPTSAILQSANAIDASRRMRSGAPSSRAAGATPEMPSYTGPKIFAARRASLTDQMSRRGRASTVLTSGGGEKLGR